MPSTIEQIHGEWGPRGLTILAVNLGEPRSLVSRWVQDRRLTIPVLLDAEGQAARAYQVTGTPTVVLIARNGYLVGRGVGPRPWLGDQGRALLEALVSD